MSNSESLIETAPPSSLDVQFCSRESTSVKLPWQHVAMHPAALDACAFATSIPSRRTRADETRKSDVSEDLPSPSSTHRGAPQSPMMTTSFLYAVICPSVDPIRSRCAFTLIMFGFAQLASASCSSCGVLTSTLALPTMIFPGSSHRGAVTAAKLSFSPTT